LRLDPARKTVLQFRRATEADIPLLRQLAERIWRDYYPAIIGHAQVDYMLPRMYAEDVIRQEITDGIVWELAAAENVPIAFFSIGLDSTGRAKMHKLYLDTQAHGRGFGKELIDRAIEVARELGASDIWLQVNKQNTRAIRAYERAGFHLEKEAVFDIGAGFVMDDFIMARGL
jgi:ribosomal protein S18 acetylase RimI-like enzyme